MKIIFDDGKEIEFDENEIGTLQDPREQIFKKDGIWYITKIINKDLAKWIDETKPMIIKEKKIPEKLIIGVTEYDEIHINNEISTERQVREVADKLNEVLDYLKSKGE